MGKSVVSFKKACEEKEALSNGNNITVRASESDMHHALYVIKELFGYMSLAEHYHAAHTRFGEDIFEGVNNLVIGGLLEERGELILQKLDDDFYSSNMGARDILVTSCPQNLATGCEKHSIRWNDSQPSLLLREEMKHVSPKTYGVMMDGIHRLKAMKPIWSEIKDTPHVQILRPSS